MSGRGGRGEPDDGGNHSFDAVHALGDEEHTVVKPLIFRKWGDELLPQEIVNPQTGETRPKLVYPAIAPEMPAEIRAVLLGQAS